MSTAKAKLLLILLFIARGTSFLFSKNLLLDMTPMGILAVRFLLAFLILALLYHRKMSACGKADLRGRCELALLALERTEIPAADYTARMDALLMDEYMPNGLRSEVAIRLPDTHAADGKPDWAVVEAKLVAALESGDWSDLTRTAYTRQSSNDKRLNALVSVVNKMADAGETTRAKALLEKGATILGYDKTPEQTLAIENKMIPATFERATLSQVRERFALLQKCRSRFDKAKFEIEEENLGIDLDEI